jgi:hypothetical protein
MSLIFDPTFLSSNNKQSTYTENAWIIEDIKKSEYIPIHFPVPGFTSLFNIPDFSFNFSTDFNFDGSNIDAHEYWFALKTTFSNQPATYFAQHHNPTPLPSSEGGDWSAITTYTESGFIASLPDFYPFNLALHDNKMYAVITNAEPLPAKYVVSSKSSFIVSSTDFHTLNIEFSVDVLNTTSTPATRIQFYLKNVNTGYEFHVHTLNLQMGIDINGNTQNIQKHYTPGEIPAGTYKPKIHFYSGHTAYISYETFGLQGVVYEFSKFDLSVSTGYPVVHDLEMGGTQGSATLIDFNSVSALQTTDDVQEILENGTYLLEEGWNIFSIPLDILSLLVGHTYHPTKLSTDIASDSGSYSLTNFLYNHLYYPIDVDIPIYYLPSDFVYNGVSYPGAAGGSNMSAWTSIVIIAKDYLGAAYLPEFNFNGVGNLKQHWGYQIKVSRDVHIRLQGNILFDESINSTDYDMDLTNGWQIISYLSLTPTNAVNYFAPLINNNQLIIAKDNFGNAFLPAWNFNGIGNLIPGQGYQIKTQNIE